MQFRNKHLSYSRISRYEQCPLSFRMHYIEKQQSNPSEPSRFGKAIHAVLEVLVREHMDQERIGRLSKERASELWQKTFAAERLSGVELFREGMMILHNLIIDQGLVHHRDLLALEKEFHLTVGPFDVIGFIDRVDRVDDETVEVIDYKTNRIIFSREEVDSSLQMSLYHLAAQQIWPWAKKVKLTFQMLRHGVRLTTERTRDQLEAALKYVEAIGEQTELAIDFPARLNTQCIYCDHKESCPAYSDALKGKRSIVCEDLNNLELVAREREEVSRLAKILYKRKQDLENIIKSHLEQNGELILAGVRYRIFNTTKVTHPLDETIKLIERVSNLPRSELIERLAIVDNKALDSLIKQLSKTLDRSRITLLKADLDASASKTQSPRFWGK